MIGEAGNDVYFVDDAADVVIEKPGEGSDVVFSTAHLGLTADVETLVLQGSANLQGYGNALANTLYGNSGDNLLNGLGGADTLTGGAGNDVFQFSAGQANGDVVIDFTGNGAAAGDLSQFVGFGPGATFTEIGASNQWQITYNGGATTEVISFFNSAAIHASDFGFI